MTLGQRLKAVRVERGLTQAEVAGPEYSAAYISTIESGRRQPSRAALEHFAAKLDVDVDELTVGNVAKLIASLERRLLDARLQISAGDLGGGADTATEVREEADAEGLTALKGRAEHLMGLSLEQGGRLDDALSFYDAAIATLSGGSRIAYVDSLARKARCHHQKGDVHYAIHLLETQLTLMEREGLTDPSALLRVHTSLVATYFDAGMLSRARASAELCIELEPRVTNLERVADMQINVARVLFEDHKWEEAASAFNKAEDLYRRLELKVELGIVHLARAYLFVQRGSLDDASHELNAAQEVFAFVDHPINRRRTQLQLGRVQRLQGKLDEAEFTLRGCLKDVPEGGLAEKALALRELAQCRQEQGNLEDAARYLLEAITDLEQVQDIQELGLTYRLFGDTMRDLEQMDRACEAYRNAALTLEAAA